MAFVMAEEPTELGEFLFGLLVSFHGRSQCDQSHRDRGHLAHSRLHDNRRFLRGQKAIQVRSQSIQAGRNFVDGKLSAFVSRRDDRAIRKAFAKDRDHDPV